MASSLGEILRSRKPKVSAGGRCLLTLTGSEYLIMKESDLKSDGGCGLKVVVP